MDGMQKRRMYRSYGLTIIHGSIRRGPSIVMCQTENKKDVWAMAQYLSCSARLEWIGWSCCPDSQRHCRYSPSLSRLLFTFSSLWQNFLELQWTIWVGRAEATPSPPPPAPTLSSPLSGFEFVVGAGWLAPAQLFKCSRTVGLFGTYFLKEEVFWIEKWSYIGLGGRIA